MRAQQFGGFGGDNRMEAVGPRGRPWSFTDYYACLLVAALVGYAVLGKGFAYLGIPNIYIGEIVLILGLIAALWTRSSFAVMASIPAIILTALMSLVLLRTIPYLAQYGVDAPRDSVVVLYGIFAFIVVSLILERPQRLQSLIAFYVWFAGWFVYLAPILLIVSLAFKDVVPNWAHSPVPLLSVRPGEVAVHLSGIAILALLGVREFGWLWSGALLVGASVIAAQSRAGALAFLIPVLAATLLSGKLRRLVPVATLAGLIFSAAALTGFELDVAGGDRKIRADQVLNNFSSIVDSSNEGNLDGTKEWRKRWWQAIVGYTVFGDRFWSGQGFGVNLAISDGFVVGEESGGPPLRSPHNAHLTILARAGVPGLLMWVLLIVSWFTMLTRNLLRARQFSQPVWANLFILLGCYELGILINASFDVALEGPMLGIWFWCIFGAGLGASMVFWASHPLRSGLLLPSTKMLAVACLAILPLNSVFAESVPVPEPPVQPAISNDTGSCLRIIDASDRVIENLRIGPCKDHGVELIRSKRILLRNLVIQGTGGIGVRVLGSEDVSIRKNEISDTLSGVHVQASHRVRVECNSLRNARGPIPRGQFVQFNEVHGPGNRVICNRGLSEPGSNPEDAISMYRSSGTEEDPIQIQHNWIRGGGPSRSGGGIMLGDDGGAYLRAQGNLLEDPGQYGIGVASGHHIEILDNIVRARSQSFTNVGIYVWRQYDAPCHSITVKGNRVQWVSSSGRANPWWDGRNCGPITGIQNNQFRIPITADAPAFFMGNCRCED